MRHRSKRLICSPMPSQSIAIVHDSEEFLLVYKPPGSTVQGADAQENLLARARQQIGGIVFPVHRLDRDTSGLVLLARTQAANRQLSLAFQEKQVGKFYLALVDRKPKKKQGSIIGDMIKGRDGNWRLSQTRLNPAVTSFFSFGLCDGRRLVVLKPKTGKTHQLRVALKALGAPIIGDRRYGGTEADRLYLHAYRLTFTLDDTTYAFAAAPREGQGLLRPEVEDRLQELGDLGGLPWPVLPP